MQHQIRVLVAGGGGFIGGHLVNRLKREGYWVRGVDVKQHKFARTAADEFLIGDLRDQRSAGQVVQGIDEVYQLAADMGGAGYIFTEEHDAAVMHNSATINLNMFEAGRLAGVKKFFYSSFCVHLSGIQPTRSRQPEMLGRVGIPRCARQRIRLGETTSRTCVITEFTSASRVSHNIFGPEGTWRGGREKAPAALCRKVAEAEDRSDIEFGGDGKQTRSFLYIDECLEGVRRLMESDSTGPVNIGSQQMVLLTSSPPW